MLFATGLVAGGTLTGVFGAILKAIPAKGATGDSDVLTVCGKIGEGVQESLAHAIPPDIFGLLFYVALGFVLVKVAIKKTDVSISENA